MSPNASPWTAITRVLKGFLAVTLFLVAAPADAQQIDIAGPAGSVAFGRSVAVLPNANIVVTDPNFGASAFGAAYLYSPSGTLISFLIGSSVNDHVGSGGVTVLSNGNYVIRSTLWNNNAATGAGAVTWASASTGVSGVVSPANSLVGTTTDDNVGSNGIVVLNNDNYVVGSPNWDNGTKADAGAATWGNGNIGVVGAISASNSLVGTTANDKVGLAVTALSIGNYVVSSIEWNSAGAAQTGAATWGDGSTGTSGVVSAANSLVGTKLNDHVGNVTALTNGNYVVASTSWDNGGTADVGAVTWCNGSTGRVGAVSAANSLIGATAGDFVGTVTALSKGNYVVSSQLWDSDTAVNAGAATWADGAAGSVGLVLAANSLVGTAMGDTVGSLGATALSNGNYVVLSPFWHMLGAATWGNGSIGIVGTVSSGNSLVGSAAGDAVGGGATALSNGNYVVRSPVWDDAGVANYGAATWGDGSIGVTGVVNGINSLRGGTAEDRVGTNIIALSNDNYVVGSNQWDHNSIMDVGAVTWGNGSIGTTGNVASGNSLIGATGSDQIGSSVFALSNGNYIVASPSWNNDAIVEAGAATWGNGGKATADVVSPANSLVGTTNGDQVGSAGVIRFSNGDYAIRSPKWDNNGTLDAGAVTLGRGKGGTVGPITAQNSVRGTVASAGDFMAVAYDVTRDTLVVGQSAANIVSLFKADLLFTNGFD